MADEAPKTVTIYAELMKAGTDAPRRELRAFVADRVENFTGDLTSELVEHLRQAYTAGVADGYRQAVIETPKPVLGDEEGERLRKIADELDPPNRLPGPVPFKSEVDAAAFLRRLAQGEERDEDA